MWIEEDFGDNQEVIAVTTDIQEENVFFRLKMGKNRFHVQPY